MSVEELWDNKGLCQLTARYAEHLHRSQQAELQQPHCHRSLICIKMMKDWMERKEGACKSTILLVPL